ncbi:glycosyltransferase family 4 protein [Rhodopirellula sp. MGV]|uniref:glycosyltransferase family 4 protein n=1 Tax=Rhodopirellula sp. MGV TaxID=2023130 RepID=UPI000B96D155|nr:glycosyltransferase family 4 protein [Rhodopirellula sp. MGV]OYP36048.1 glycosyl transferase family 1 [Rhodopirellula sp. MGV]PNY36593.1 glycosyltransferase family 1 protein [Rhodopirellula baltica]
MKVVYLTAGAAGMYCGSCMHDNALARAMHKDGIECLLQPVYTPIRTDEVSIAGSRVFLGGIHVYLLQKMPWLRWLPRPLRSLLDSPSLIRWATRRASSTDPASLGDLSISILKGEHGYQAEEFEQLCDWVADEIQPDAIVLTNLLIGGGLPMFRKRLPNAKMIVMLQGDDIFLDHLPEVHRNEAIRLCSNLVEHVDYFCVNSRFYGDKMSALLEIPETKLRLHPLSIDLSSYDTATHQDASDAEFRLSYLARIAPEKGLHRLVEAFEKIAPQRPQVTLHAAGWLGESNKPYLQTLLDRLERAGLRERFTYHGSPDLAEKVDFLRQADLLCVPTEYEDPKGLFVLESLAAGTPVVMPEHGAFGELVRSTGGGVLVPPDDVGELANAIIELVDQPARRAELAMQGAQGVRTKHSIEAAAKSLAALCLPG